MGRKKHFYAVILFEMCAGALFGGAWYYDQRYGEDNMRGKYTFAQTREKLNYIGNIKMITPQSGEINIYRSDDGNWRFKEANEYYINNEALAAFFSMVKNSVVVAVQKADAVFLQRNDLLDENGTLIETYDYEGKPLDEVVLGKTSGEDGLFWARKKRNELSVYKIGGVKDFSASAQAWIPYPLLNINPTEIKSIAINGRTVGRQELDVLLERSVAWRDLMRTLDVMEYQGLSFKSDLAELPSDAKVRKIDVVLFSGMIYKLTVLDVNASYWILISMDAMKLFYKEAIEVAAERYKYYADWIFQLSDKQGRSLFSDELLGAR